LVQVLSYSPSTGQIVKVSPRKRQSILIPGEETPMTFQVGLIGDGGIILGSDLRITTDGSIREEDEGSAAYVGELGRKIEFDQRVAISCADDLIFARKVAKRIIN